MSSSRVHHCPDQVKIAEGSKEPPAAKCRCRKYYTLHKATELVRRGDATWVVLRRHLEPQEATCHLCKADPEVKNCANCKGTGVEIKTIEVNTYGEDLVLVSQTPVNSKTGRPEKKRSSALAQKTPRSATVEKGHIQRAYLELQKEAAERIEEYGLMNRDFLVSLGAQLKNPDTGTVFVEGNPEPEDDASKAQGRRYDYGRAL
jgi:hypothetical protein